MPHHKGIKILGGASSGKKLMTPISLKPFPNSCCSSQKNILAVVFTDMNIMQLLVQVLGV